MSEDAGRADVLARLDVSRETTDRLDAFYATLIRWNASINLVSRTTIDEVWTRHIFDSAQIFGVPDRFGTLWVDLGTGGGFPGMIIAILAPEKSSDLQVTCVEADIRKASFLRTTADALGISLGVLSRRIEEVPPMGAGVLSARALAPLSKLLEHAERHLAPGGQAVFLKGRSWEQEKAEALEIWRFTCDAIPSQTDPDSVILKIGGIERV